METMEINEDLLKSIKQEESLKLIKMTKGYNWEIKLVGSIDEKRLKRLEEINTKLQETYQKFNYDL